MFVTAPGPRCDVSRYRLRKDELQFLIIDVQERLVAAMPERERVVTNIGHLVALGKMFAIPAVVTEQYPRGLGPTVPAVAEAIAGTSVIEKLEFCCLEKCEVATRLADSQRRQVVVVGMYAGNIVELTSNQEIFKEPLHPYTQGLLSAIPRIDQELPRLEIIEGSVPNLSKPPAGCRFHPRCPYAMSICSKEKPAMIEIKPGHSVACHLYTEAKQ